MVECRKIYWQDMEPANFLDSEIHGNYAGQDYHRLYTGEIVAVSGAEPFRPGVMDAAAGTTGVSPAVRGV